MYSDDQYGCIIPRVYRKGQYLVLAWDSHPMLTASFLNAVFQFGDEALKGNCSVGQLTTIGFYQHLMNGYSLRKAYVNSGFLSKNLSRSEVYIRSDSMCQNVFLCWCHYHCSPLPFQMCHAHSRHVPIIHLMPTHHNITVCIPDIHVCVQSAESLMLGMFPPNGSYTEVVELHTMDTTFDDITANPQYVP